MMKIKVTRPCSVSLDGFTPTQLVAGQKYEISDDRLARSLISMGSAVALVEGDPDTEPDATDEPPQAQQPEEEIVVVQQSPALEIKPDEPVLTTATQSPADPAPRPTRAARRQPVQPKTDVKR